MKPSFRQPPVATFFEGGAETISVKTAWIVRARYMSVAA
jgi:hypothetical protein